MHIHNHQTTKSKQITTNTLTDNAKLVKYAKTKDECRELQEDLDQLLKQTDKRKSKIWGQNKYIP